MTVWDAADDSALKMLASKPGYMELIEEKWPLARHFADVAFQHSTSRLTDGYVSPVDKLATVELVAALEAGLVGMCAISVGSAPNPDADIDANRDALKGLPPPFSADVERGQSLGLLTPDGFLEWTQPIKVVCGNGEVEVDPMALPLEIGTMGGSRMRYAINPETGPGMARWPYGSDVVFAIIPPHVIRMMKA